MVKKTKETKEQPAEERKKSLTERLQSKFPAGITAKSVEDVTSVYGIRRPFGIPSMDIPLGGGLPAGNVVQLIGAEGVGKDYLANRQIAQVQRNYGKRSKVFIASFGYPVDKTALLLAGVHLPYTDDIGQMGIQRDDPKYAHLFDPIGEIILLEGHKVESKTEEDIRPAESVIQAVLACIETGEFQMGILNELPAGKTTWHARTPLGGNSRTGALASLMADFQKYYYEAMKVVDANETSLFILNQLRDNVQMGSYVNPNAPKTKQAGGWSLKYLKAIDMELKVCGRIKTGADKDVVGKRIAWNLSKGKCGLSEGHEGEYDFIFNAGVDLGADLLYVCQQLGLILAKGAWYYFEDPEGLEQKILGKDKIKAAISKPEVYDYLLAKAYIEAGLTGVTLVSPERPVVQDG